MFYKALHTSKSFAQVFTFNIRRLVHDLYTRVSQQDGVPVMKPSMSACSFDAVVPEILTFRPDKDDPLDISSDHQVSLREEHDHTKEIKEKRMELITAVVSTIASWNISEAFEQVCCKSLSLSKEISQNVSYGLKG